MNERQQAALARLMDALDAPTEVRELARALAHRAFAAEVHVGWAVEKVAASAVFVAFRRAGNAHTLAEIAAVTDLSRSGVGRAYRRLARELDIDLEPADPHEFVERFAAPFALGERVESAAHDIIEKTVEAGLHSGVTPAGVAAAALYLADREHHGRLTQREIADVAGVSEVTIRHRYAEQADLLGVGDRGTLAPGRWKHLDTD
jgi:transcription initiation factor TFIIB